MGYGDEVMASAEAREMKQAHPDAKVVIGNGEREVWHEIFEGNPNVTRLADVGPGDRVVWLRNYYGHRPYLDYARCRADRQFFLPYRARPGDLYFSAAELAAAAAVLDKARERGLPLVAIEPNVAFGPNKDWGSAHWQQVADLLWPRATVLQPSYGEPLLNGVVDVPSSFRQFAAVLAGCDLHVGSEGGLHHAAAAVGCPAVVLFGGRIHPNITGYAFHVNLYRDIAGSPCGMIAPCAHCRHCLDSITVEEVVEASLRLLDLAWPSEERLGPSPSRSRQRE
jgi:ADP-heptose:LPS heptosyltransferase